MTATKKTAKKTAKKPVKHSDIHALSADIAEVVGKYSGKLTLGEAIGALEFVKLDLYRQNLENKA